MARYVWKGIATHADVFDEPPVDGEGRYERPLKLVFSGMLTPGSAIDAELDPDWGLVKSWLAARLIEPVPADKAAARGAKSQKEQPNG